MSTRNRIKSQIARTHGISYRQSSRRTTTGLLRSDVGCGTLPGAGYAANRDCVVARSTLSQHASNPSTVPLLLAAYDAVWAKVEPRVTSDDTERVQDAIYLALITLSGAGQGDRVRLEAYALDRALAAMTAPRVADVGKIGGQGTG